MEVELRVAVDLLVCTVRSDRHQVDKIFVVQLLDDVELVLKSVEVGSFGFELLDGHQLVIGALSQLDSE